MTPAAIKIRQQSGRMRARRNTSAGVPDAGATNGATWAELIGKAQAGQFDPLLMWLYARLRASLANAARGRATCFAMHYLEEPLPDRGVVRVGEILARLGVRHQITNWRGNEALTIAAQRGLEQAAEAIVREATEGVSRRGAENAEKNTGAGVPDTGVTLGVGARATMGIDAGAATPSALSAALRETGGRA